MTFGNRRIVIALGAWAFAFPIFPADARPARCFTSDDGHYRCDFRQIDGDGSFSISARGKPTYLLNMIGRGVATGVVGLGGRGIGLPGRFIRSRSDGGCWENDTTRVKICAW